MEVILAFSSVIGRVKFMERYGLSVHEAVSLVLARRLLGCSERVPRGRVAHPEEPRKCCLPPPSEEAREARVGALGCNLWAAETGVCSAIPAVEAETQTRSRSGFPSGETPALVSAVMRSVCPDESPGRSPPEQWAAAR